MYLDCCSNYHNNFVVQNGQRLYYSGIPEYIQVGEHQFVEQRIVKMWVNMMLVAWYVLAITYLLLQIIQVRLYCTRLSASNLAKLYEMSFTNDYLQDHEWQFVRRLATEHVWDAFVVYSLLDDKRRQGKQLNVPHIGSQADRFTQAMEERNRNIILYGQPDAVTHMCDKCLRVCVDEGGIRESICFNIMKGSNT